MRWNFMIYTCVLIILCLIFKRFRMHMNWIQHFEQMNVDKILHLRKKIVEQLAFYWGKNKYSYNKIIRKVRKTKMFQY